MTIKKSIGWAMVTMPVWLVCGLLIYKNGLEFALLLLGIASVIVICVCGAKIVVDDEY